jgi:hypothetical protein
MPGRRLRYGLLFAVLGCGGLLGASEAVAQGNRASTPRFSVKDEKIIREYFAAYPAETTLTPLDGPMSQPVKGQRLRPATDSRPLPRDLAIRLKPPPKGYQRVIVDNDVLVVSARTGAIADVLLDLW